MTEGGRFTAPDGTRLAYRVLGTGDPIVCLPGGPMQDAGFGSGFTNVITQRLTLMTKLSTGDFAAPAFTTQLKQVAAQMKKVSENLDFQKPLNELSPVQEFLALEKVVAGKVT